MRNKIIFAWRALKANRLCSFISIIGLGIGLACMLTIVKYLWQEYSTDRFHDRYDRIYACISMASQIDIPDLSEIMNCKDKLEDYPEVEAQTTVGMFTGENLVVSGKEIKADILFTDPDFFDVFTFPLVVGDTATALKQTTDMVVTESFAQKVFGNQDPLGKEIPYWNQTYRITGVLKDPPVNSSFSFDILITDRSDFSRMKAEFIVLNKKADIGEVGKRLTEDKFFGRQHYYYDFVPFAGLYFNKEVNTTLIGTFRHGNMQSLTILLLAGIIILSISIVNYVNMYQVSLLKREKEIAVKQVHGVSRFRLWSDFWIENFLMIMLAFGLASIMLGTLSGWIENFLGIPLRFSWKFDLLLGGGIFVCLPLLTAWLPFLKYSRIQPALAMKSSGMTKRAVMIRHLLLGLQYVMTIVMLVVSIYFIRQLHFMLHKDIGIQRENILQAHLFKEPKLEMKWVEDEQEREAMWQRRRTIMEKHRDKVAYVENEIKKYPYIQHPCAGSSFLDYNFMSWKNSASAMDFMSCALIAADPEFFRLYGLQLVAGRFFDAGKDRGRDPIVVINETAMKTLGIGNQEEAELTSNAWGSGWKVVGVVKDFRYTHLSAPIPPLVMVYFGDKDDCPYHMHVTQGKERETLAFLRQLYATMGTPGELEYSFFEDQVESLYAKDRKIVMIATLFTLLAVCISSLGLFGFAYFDARRRYREIGIRKVNGATATEILCLLIRRFVVLIGAAFVIAAPVAWLGLQRYRESYLECTPLTGWIFLLALSATSAVAVCTLLWQSRKAAMANPVEALRNE